MLRMSEHFSFEQLDPVLRYANGRLFWKKSIGHIAAGSVAGRACRDGYRAVQYRGRAMLEHRVIWVLCTGSWPKRNLDHINGIRDDNRIENLRECSRSQNQWNRKPTKGRKFKGVCKLKNGKFMASISNKYIGEFESPNEAALAYDKAAIKRYGEFARLNFQVNSNT